MGDENESYLRAREELKKASDDLRQFKKKEPPYCSFCGRGRNEYLHLIESKRISKICDQCVMECVHLLNEKISDEKDK